MDESTRFYNSSSLAGGWSTSVSGSSTGDDSSDISPACTKCEQWMPPSNSLADSKATRTGWYFQSSPILSLLPAKPPGLRRKSLCYVISAISHSRAETTYVDSVARDHLIHLYAAAQRFHLIGRSSRPLKKNCFLFVQQCTPFGPALKILPPPAAIDQTGKRIQRYAISATAHRALFCEQQYTAVPQRRYRGAGLTIITGT